MAERKVQEKKGLADYLSAAADQVAGGVLDARDYREGHPVMQQLRKNRPGGFRHPLEMVTGGVEGLSQAYFDSKAAFPQSREAWFERYAGKDPREITQMNPMLRGGLDALRILQTTGEGALGLVDYAEGDLTLPPLPLAERLRRLGK